MGDGRCLENSLGEKPCGFDSHSLRDVPLAEWFSTGLLIRGGRFDPFAAHEGQPERR